MMKILIGDRRRNKEKKSQEIYVGCDGVQSSEAKKKPSLFERRARRGEGVFVDLAQQAAKRFPRNPIKQIDEIAHNVVMPAGTGNSRGVSITRKTYLFDTLRTVVKKLQA